MKATRSILIVEDSDDDYEATLRALQKDNPLNAQICRCETGEEVLDFLEHRGKFANKENFPLPSVILLDINLPGLDGKEVLKTIKQTTKFKKIPIIVLTTSEDEKDIEKCYEYGANTYIKKPISLEHFVHAIKTFKEFWLKTAILPNKVN